MWAKPQHERSLDARTPRAQGKLGTGRAAGERARETRQPGAAVLEASTGECPAGSGQRDTEREHQAPTSQGHRGFGAGATSHSLQGDMRRRPWRAEGGPRLVLLFAAGPAGPGSAWRGARFQERGAGSLPGVCILPLQLMPLKALSHLFLAANIPAEAGAEGKWGSEAAGRLPQSTSLWPGGQGAPLPPQLCSEPFQRSFLATEPSSLSPLITSILWFLPGEELRREERQMLFK